MFQLRELTLGGLISETAEKYGERTAVEYKDSVMSYLALDAQTDIIARGFMAMGVKKGSHVGIWANDRPNTLLTFIAALKIGAVAVMIGVSLNELEVAGLIEQADVELLIFDEGFKDVSFPDVCRNLELDIPLQFLYIGESPENAFPQLTELENSALTVTTEQLIHAKNAVSCRDEDTILFTSGTTGISKAVLTTHYSRINTAFAHADSLEITKNDKFLIAIPLFHCFSLTGGVYTALVRGACIHFPENRRTQSLLNSIALSRCTVFNAVPTLFSALLARSDLKSYDLSSLRTGFIGGSIYTSDFFKRVNNELNFTLMPALGQTEASAGFTFAKLSDSLEIRASTIGTFMPHIEGKIRDISTGADMQTGESGEICIRGFNVMKGYYKRPDLSAVILSEDGWLRSGDLGYIGEDGYIRITGRLKELIIRGGENIAPGEIEDIIGGDARIAAVKVISVPDAHYGEEICACLKLKEGSEISTDEVKNLVRARLAYFKVPKYVLFLDEFPHTSGGKIALNRLQEYAKSVIFS